MEPTPVVLFDMDGVIVHNVEFERSVTALIVERYAASHNVTIDQADRIWHTELVSSKGQPAWYDYDFHCERLGLPRLAREAHQQSSLLLGSVLDAAKTIEMLREANVSFGIVSDAMRWVVEFKLATLRLESPDFIFTSDMAESPKKSSQFWRRFIESRPARENYIYVDNRIVNLDSAGEVLERRQLVCFVGDEHVLNLSGVLDDELKLRNDGQIAIVSDHLGLTECIGEFLRLGVKRGI